MLFRSSAPAPSSPAALVLTPEQMTAAILELGQAVADIRAFLVGPYAPQPQPWWRTLCCSRGSVAVDGIDQHDLVDATAADETLEHALHMEELMQITDCNQLRGFDEAPAAVHFAESDRIDSAVVAAPPSLTTSPAAPSAAVVVPAQFHTATPLAASAPSPTTTVSATSLCSSSPTIVTSPMKTPAATTPAVSSSASPTPPRH